MKKSCLRVLALLCTVMFLQGCMTCCYDGRPEVLKELQKIQNPTQVANDLWLKLIANHFTNESRVYRFCFADEKVWQVKPGSQIRQHVYDQAKNERHVRVAPVADARYILGVRIVPDAEGKKVVFTLKTIGVKGKKIVHTTILAEPSPIR